MTFRSILAAAPGGVALALLSLPAWAQDAAAPTPDKGDTAWMLVSTVLVLLMVVPGLALFYGGLVRTKNMLSVLTQVFAIACLAALVWVLYGYSLAFTNGGGLNDYVGGFSKAFLRGVDATTVAATFSNGVVIPEYAVSFLPKLKIEVAVAADFVGRVVEAITAAARTGQIGDGKIFVTSLERAVRIRTGETDGDAL